MSKKKSLVHFDVSNGYGVAACGANCRKDPNLKWCDDKRKTTCKECKTKQKYYPKSSIINE